MLSYRKKLQLRWIKNLKYLCLLLALPFIELPFAFSTEYTATTTLRINMRENSPYNKGGIAEDVFNRVECILIKIKQPFTIQLLPWKRAQVGVSQDRDHGFFPASKNKIRQEKYIASNLINDGFIYWFTEASSQLNPNRDSLKNLKVGAIRGTSAAKWASKKTLALHETTDQDKLFELLYHQRVEAVITSLESYKSSDVFHSNRKYKVLKAYPRKQYVFFSKSFINHQPQFLERFNAEIDGCIQEFPFKFLWTPIVNMPWMTIYFISLFFPI